MSEATKKIDTVVTVISAKEKITENNNERKNYAKKPPSIKKRGPMNIIKVALYMFRKKRDVNKPTKSIPIATNATLTKLVGSVRPLYGLQDGIGGTSPPPPPSLLLLPPPSPESEVVVAAAAGAPPLYSYAASPSPSSSSYSLGGMSRYASAQSLYDLDNHDDEDQEDDNDESNDVDAYYDGLEGDDMIDAKAEMFIAKFYQQMRLDHKSH